MEVIRFNEPSFLYNKASARKYFNADLGDMDYRMRYNPIEHETIWRFFVVMNRYIIKLIKEKRGSI